MNDYKLLATQYTLDCTFKSKSKKEFVGEFYSSIFDCSCTSQVRESIKEVGGV